jgi:class 3 adenylate cyclase
MKKPMIFIVDDDPIQGRAMGQLLATNGYEIKSFTSARQLLALRSDLADCGLVISDINMPEMTGLELCAAIRAESEYGRIPVILITGNDVQNEKAAGLEAGADDFIGKPCRSMDLLAKIRSLLAIRRQEVATLEELRSTQSLNQRLQRLQRFLSPNVANMLTVEQLQPLLQPHRVEVSVFFVDLRGFTSFSERFEPEEVLSVLSDYYTAVGNSAIHHQGTLGHLAGDGIMVFFNDPEPVPDHQEASVRMALDVRASLLSQRKVWRARQYGIDFGIGLSAGFATIGEIGFEQFSQYSVIGPVSNFAARLSSAADDGQILISHRFYSRLPEGACAVELLGERQIKGLDGTAKIYNILTQSLKKAA